MHEEQDTCRICSAPAEPDQPLFYPCKCSGTIRYIHQDCLTTWLAHSKKKTCDVCKYPYSFTKVYASDMPASLPLVLLVRRLAQQTALGILFALRAVMVGSIWLAFLPWSTIWTWRMYFALGDSIAWWISSRPRPQPSEILAPSNTTLSTNNSTTPSSSDNTTLLTSFLTHPTVRSISADIVSGQIIASLIVLGFVAVFLLREWISQNARPGVFDEADGPIDGQDQPIPVQAVRGPPQPDDDDDEDEDALPVEPANLVFAPIPEQIPIPLARPEGAARPKPRTFGEDLGGTWEPYETYEPIPRVDRKRIVPREEPAVPDSSELDTPHPSGLHRRHHSWDGYNTSPNGSPPLKLQPEQTQFTFRASSSRAASPEFSEGQSTAVDRSPFYGPSDMPPEYTSDSEGTTHWGDDISHPVRPVLPTTSLSGSSSPARSVGKSRAQTPSGSPSLATYRAPEELEAGPSVATSSKLFYDELEQNGEPDNDGLAMRDSYDQYFRDPSRTELEDETEDEDATVVEHNPERLPPTQWSDEEFEEEEDDDGPFGEEPDEDRPEEVEPPVNGPRDQQQPPREEAEIIDPEEEVNLEDDMDGALEAIGLRGPIYGVLQNAALMIFVLDTTIGCLVFLPFVIGKTVGLLALDPRRFLQVLHWPIRAIRFITDPVVDLVLYLIARTVVPPLSRMSHAILESSGRVVSSLAGENLANKGFDLGSTLLNRTMEVVNIALDQGYLFLASAPEVPAVQAPTLLERMAANDSTFFRIAEPYFAPLGSAVRLGSQDFRMTWLRLAIGNGTSERLFAIALGYTIDAILVALYLNVLTVGSVRSAGRAFRNAVRQQLLVIKVAAFIIVELVIFPLGCGVMLDICTVWLFPMGSFKSRATFLVFAPLTSAFYHWVVGTMFMYQFAILLAGCRSIMRPGAMWFIKDPQDQNFHPIRDILERPTFVQIRKLLLSALMYGMVVAGGVATVSGILRVFSRTIMPFRWKIREPLSVVPIDLLFMHIVLPYTMHYFRPKRVLHKIGVHLWKYLAGQLRLTSYMFGTRRSLEEYTSQRWSWRGLFITPGIEMDDYEAIHDGTYRRVPASDNVVLVKNERATVEVNDKGEPATMEDRRVMMLQNLEAEKAKRSVKDDYTIVYLPPHFRYRVTFFILSLWFIGSVMLAFSIAAPILVGRGFFRLFIPHHVHDGYSFFAGFFLLWACWLVGQTVDRMDKHRQRRGGEEPRAELPLYVAKRSLLWSAQIIYLAFFLGFVIPTLIATVMELYVIMPVRYTLNPEMKLKIRVVDMWALGLLYAKIAMRAHRLQPEGPLLRGIEHIRRTGWTHPDPFRATKEVIAPLTGGLLGMILLPPALLWVARVIFSLPMSEDFLFLHVYPTIFTVAGCTHGIVSLSHLIGAWSQGVRDKEFLVEMRLQNLESDSSKMDAGVGTANGNGNGVVAGDSL